MRHAARYENIIIGSRLQKYQIDETSILYSASGKRHVEMIVYGPLVIINDLYHHGHVKPS